MTAACIAAVLGGVLYGVPTHPKLNEIGRLVFFSGAFWVVWLLAHGAKLPL
jgi:hypothetical protein